MKVVIKIGDKTYRTKRKKLGENEAPCDYCELSGFGANNECGVLLLCSYVLAKDEYFVESKQRKRK